MREGWGDLEEGEGWSPLCTRLFNDWELENVERLLFGFGWVVLAMRLRME